ncbi:MAG: beta-ketoacyl-[acyl-carrier-protein] synthase family protein [Luteibacter sp.]|uniref:beta-ketoacyl-[acyl-carrier-protein] synthase family protein n=1 Tax=Luteibacter TaxID=242605 RepID=UPI00055BABCD|nr:MULTISPECIES: beta-ketoacyl-[acyl-carrier-protein] synthase family protein [unclassified Luteibacter]MDQ7996027.1 beta-ketoacyl-[acyl-carrier-protein] synthase family protein [Luteibacter sp.]MDQ8048792.1 beta-ketoacyl-[acyl-carrier-protein] synthase family protein [Luteibacter sp.]
MRRVVVTGMGAVSCLGPDRRALFDGLRAQRAGFREMPDFATLGMRCRVGAPADIAALEPPHRKLRRYLPQAAEYAWHAAREALAEAGLDEDRLRERDVGIVMGGSAALSEYEAGLDMFHARGISRLSPFIVPRSMGSAVAATLTHAFGFGGRAFTVSSACTSATHAIGQAMELIQLGRQDVVICGGAEELHDKAAMCFDVMNALSTTSAPGERVSAPYEADRDGILLGGGAGVLVLESLEHAQARGATILAEMAGYGAASDPDGMISPEAGGMAEAMHQAIDLAGTIPDYINTHACATIQGDLAEWHALCRVFGDRGFAVPWMSSIKGLIGHAPAAAGALDTIAGIAMMEAGVLLGGAPVRELDEAFADAPLIEGERPARIGSFLSNTFGFGGSCAALVVRRFDGAGA